METIENLLIILAVVMGGFLLLFGGWTAVGIIFVGCLLYFWIGWFGIVVFLFLMFVIYLSADKGSRNTWDSEDSKYEDYSDPNNELL